MATPEQIAELRRLIAEPTDGDPYTDEQLSNRIDAADDVTALAATIWREKAASYASLVDVQEGSSSRKLSSLHSQALLMAAQLGGNANGFRAARTRPIERP